MGLKAVFFDAGNTIVHIDYGFIACAMSLEGFVKTPESIREAECRARVRLDKILAKGGSTEAFEVFKAYMKFTFEGLGIPWGEGPERVYKNIVDYHRRTNLWNSPNPDAFEVLKELRSKGLILGVISNSDGSIEGVLQRAGLASLFHFILDSGVVGVEKPDPKIFMLALEKAEAAPERALHIGDIYSVDILGSMAAGLHGLLIDPVGAWEGVECQKVKDLKEAREFILDKFR